MTIFLLPVSVTFVVLLLLYTSTTRSPNIAGRSFRRSFLISLLLQSCLIFLFNEIFSIFNGISLANAVTFWSVIVGIEALLLIHIFKNSLASENLNSDKQKTLSLNNLSNNRLTIYAGVLLYGLPLFLLTAIVPPNNFDAHSYHLSRIIEWIGNGNVNHFATRHIQQLYHNVFSEYLVMHAFLLGGGDQFAGFVQFFACVGSILALSLVAKRLGASVSGQVLCAIMLLTLPIGIFESTSVQVDYVACFFFISFLYFGYEAIDSPHRDTLIAMALSLSFGAFSKYTILMYALPFSIYFGIKFLQIRGFVSTIKILAMFICVLTVVFSPFMTRNYQFFGNILSPVEGYGLEVETLSVADFSLAASVSGIIKNASLHIGLPLNSYNSLMEGLIIKAHRVLGLDVNDPRYSMDLFTVRYVAQEDMVPNNIHFVLILLSIISLCFVKTEPRLKWFTFCAFMGFTIFSSAMVFQLWSTRTHMPFFCNGLCFGCYHF